MTHWSHDNRISSWFYCRLISWQQGWDFIAYNNMDQENHSIPALISSFPMGPNQARWPKSSAHPNLYPGSTHGPSQVSGAKKWSPPKIAKNYCVRHIVTCKMRTRQQTRKLNVIRSNIKLYFCYFFNNKRITLMVNILSPTVDIFMIAISLVLRHMPI